MTVNRDGSPLVIIVWSGLEGDEVVCAHLSHHQKLRNIRRDPRVAPAMMTGGNGLLALKWST